MWVGKPLPMSRVGDDCFFDVSSQIRLWSTGEVVIETPDGPRSWIDGQDIDYTHPSQPYRLRRKGYGWLVLEVGQQPVRHHYWFNSYRYWWWQHVEVADTSAQPGRWFRRTRQLVGRYGLIKGLWFRFLSLFWG